MMMMRAEHDRTFEHRAGKQSNLKAMHPRVRSRARGRGVWCGGVVVVEYSFLIAPNGTMPAANEWLPYWVGTLCVCVCVCAYVKPTTTGSTPKGTQTGKGTCAQCACPHQVPAPPASVCAPQRLWCPSLSVSCSLPVFFGSATTTVVRLSKAHHTTQSSLSLSFFLSFLPSLARSFSRHSLGPWLARQHSLLVFCVSKSHSPSLVPIKPLVALSLCLNLTYTHTHSRGS